MLAYKKPTSALLYIFLELNYSHSVSLWGRYADCCYLMVLCLELFIAGFAHQRQNRRPFSVNIWGVFSLPKKYEILIKTYGPELVDQSK